jgi:dTDP-4-amino-4,6-dideoxygalactose transaminase
LGSNYEYTCFSFQAIKHLTTADGGALALRDGENCPAARRLRWFGLDRKVPGSKRYHPRRVQIRDEQLKRHIGSVQLRHMSEVIESTPTTENFMTES